MFKLVFINYSPRTIVDKTPELGAFFIFLRFLVLNGQKVNKSYNLAEGYERLLPSN